MTDDVNDIAKLVSNSYFKLFFIFYNNHGIMLLTFLRKVNKSWLESGEYLKKYISINTINFSKQNPSLQRMENSFRVH